MLFSYLRRHIKIILMLCVFVLIFAAVFSLYELPAEAVLYAAILCVFTGGVLFFIGYAGYLKRHRVLSEMLPRITLSIDSLPAPHGAPESDYQALIKALAEAKAASASLADMEKRDLVDYYTLWAPPDKNTDRGHVPPASELRIRRKRRAGDGTFQDRAVCRDGHAVPSAGQ